MANARWVPKFPQTLRFDLANAFASDFELLADFFERSRVAIGQTKAQLENLAFALSQAAQHVSQFALQQTVAGHVHRVLSFLVLDEVAEVRFVAVTNRALQRNRLLRHLQN